MAGDWIKMTHALPEKPEVLAIAGKTGLNRFDVVGRLFILWRWFDNNTTDGNAASVTSVTLEECLFGYGSNVGFVAAVRDARWLVENDEGIRVVKFDEHISESAKTRAQTAKRVAKSKANGKGNASANAEGNGESVTDGVTKTVPREEKRREEKEHPPTPKGEGRFPEFWDSWPKSDRKGGRGECLKVWKSKGFDSQADSILAHVAAMAKTESWTKQGGEFIPAPVVYLRGGRWDGADLTASHENFAGAI